MFIAACLEKPALVAEHDLPEGSRARRQEADSGPLLPHDSRCARASSWSASCALLMAARLVPTYFSTTAAAISNATTFSTITLAAGTAQTSERSYAAGCG